MHAKNIIQLHYGKNKMWNIYIANKKSTKKLYSDIRQVGVIYN